MPDVFFRSLFSRSAAARKAVAVFFIKCVAGVVICYYLYLIWPDYHFDWAMISVVLALSFDNSKKLAVDRIVSNTLGCMIGLMLFPVPLPHVLLLAIGVVIVIVAAFVLNVTDMIRPALAAFVIVMLREQNSQLWFVPLQRVIAVMAGCVVALLLTLLFSLFVPKDFSEKDLNQ